MPLSPATRLGPYEIVSSIGAGGMGEVYRAHDTKLGRDVAIKVLPDAFANDAERMARFEREAQVVASLNHPNIATIHGVEESNSIRGLVMELVEGPTLADRIVNRAIPLEEALTIAKQIAEGLEYAHERGIIHRDLKPANIKLTGDGQVKLLDFGLAKALDKPISAGNPSISPTLTLEGTRAGVILGTAAYMAPEQARGATVDKRADIWAYGCVLYEMLSGKRAFAGDTVSDTLAAVLRAEPEWNTLPISTRRLIRRCLEKEPKRRLRDIGEARLMIEELTTASNIVPENMAQRLGSRAVLWPAVALLAVVSLVLGALLWRSTRPLPQQLMRFNLELGQEVYSAILSPDGLRLVYSGRETDGKWRLYTRQLDQEKATPLGGTEAALGSFFSPDGQFVGFFADGKLKKVSVHGGGPVVLCDAPEGRGGSWGEDGNIIAALSLTDSLSRVPADGGTPQRVTELDKDKKEITHRWPQVLPGSQAVLFTAHTTTANYEEAAIEAQSLKTGKRKTLVRGGFYGRYVPSGHLLYMRQGTLYAAPMDVEGLQLRGPAVPVVEQVPTGAAVGLAHFAFSQNGTLVFGRRKTAKATLVWLEGNGRTQPLRAAESQYFALRFSPDGKRLAAVMDESGNPDLWVYDWQRDAITRLTFAPGMNTSPVWSPDGKHIAFASERHGGVPNLYWMRADGSGEAVRLTESKNYQFPSSFSPDGRQLAFSERSPKSGWDLWTVRLEAWETDHPKAANIEPLLATPFNEDEPMISPDGRWVAYRSDESGAMEVYVRPFARKGGKWEISTAGGERPVWSKKRQELFYRSREGMMMVSYTAKGEVFDASKPRIQIAKKTLRSFDLAPDGKRFAAVQELTSEQNGSTQLTFLLNFFDELRRRAPAAGK